MTSKRKALIKALIHFHWKNIVKDNAQIGVREMKRRLAVIEGLRKRINEPNQYKAISGSLIKNKQEYLFKK